MESDYDVCIECGSLAECEHDREIGSATSVDPVPSNVHPLSHNEASTTRETDYLEMRGVQPIPPFTEVYNTYGPLSNATLLSRYGFTLPENEHDIVRMVLEPFVTVTNMFAFVAQEGHFVGDDDNAVTQCGAVQVERLEIRSRPRQPSGQGVVNNETRSSSTIRGEGPCPSALSIHPCDASSPENTISRVLHVFTYVARAWSADSAWDELDDGLVFNPDPQAARPVSIMVGDESFQISHDFVINSDGKISHNLWLLCVLVALYSVRPHLEPAFVDLVGRVESGCETATWLPELKARLLKIQGYVERLRHVHDEESVGGDIEKTASSTHGSTSPPSFPHLALTPLNVGYDTESDGFALPDTTAQVQPGPSPEPGEKSISITATTDSSSLSRDEFLPEVIMGQFLGSGPHDPEISSSFSPRAKALSQDTLPRSLPGASAARSSTSRDRSSSAEGERPLKRVRHSSDSIGPVRELLCAHGLGSGTPESAREASSQEVQDLTHCDALLTDADHRVTLALVRAVVGLCHGRYCPPTVRINQLGNGMSAAELGELLDETPEDMHRTRSALLLAIGERSVVESCAASWGIVEGQ